MSPVDATVREQEETRCHHRVQRIARAKEASGGEAAIILHAQGFRHHNQDRLRAGERLAAGICFLVLAAAGCSPLVHRLGGAWAHAPDEMEQGLSEGARTLVRNAFAGLDPARLRDFHVHAFGGGPGSPNSYRAGALSWLDPFGRARFQVLMSAAAVVDLDAADREYADRLVDLASHIPGHGKFHLLAFDHLHRPDGSADRYGSEFHVANEYVVDLARRHPDLFVPVISVHPYRSDAVQELVRWARGDQPVRFVKWLPNSMGIDPDPKDPALRAKVEAFYRAMAAEGMTLLTHTGHEQALATSSTEQEYGNPTKLRLALDLGVRVIAAHCAGFGDYPDPARPGTRVPAFDLFLRLLEDPKYAGRLFGEISALTVFNRIGLPGGQDPLRRLLERPELHPRLVDGSDYPIPAVNTLVRTRKLAHLGYVTWAERELLNEIYDYNPLLFDFVVKRTLRHPETRARLSDCVFQAPDALWNTRPESAPGDR